MGRAAWLAGMPVADWYARALASLAIPGATKEDRAYALVRASYGGYLWWESSVRRDSCSPKRRRCSTSSATNAVLPTRLGGDPKSRTRPVNTFLPRLSRRAAGRDRRGDRRRRHRHDGQELALQPALFPRCCGRRPPGGRAGLCTLAEAGCVKYETQKVRLVVARTGCWPCRRWRARCSRSASTRKASPPPNARYATCR